MKVDQASSDREHAGAHQQIKQPVALKDDERLSQQSLAAELRHIDVVTSAAALSRASGDNGQRSRAARFERCMNAPAVSGDTNSAASPTSNTRSPAIDRPVLRLESTCAPRDDVHRCEIESLRELFEKRVEIGGIAGAALPSGQADLRDADTVERPADIAAREPAVAETVQAPGLRQRDSG